MCSSECWPIFIPDGLIANDVPYRITIAVMVSFIARALNSINGHIFCYSAIASGGIVLILPGFIACECDTRRHGGSAYSSSFCSVWRARIGIEEYIIGVDQDGARYCICPLPGL